MSPSAPRTEDEASRRVQALRRWYSREGRSFPWRHTRSPWAIFVAEMLLRRTRAEQVARHFELILDAYPNAEAMANAPAAEVFEALRPLGLMWRADTLRRAAIAIQTRHRGIPPADRHSLMEFPGVGPYVASATFAAITGQRVLLLDTNTVRVALRIAGYEPRGDVRRAARTRDAIRDAFGGPADAVLWWAVLDLAALVCRPRTPHCDDCPIRQFCVTGKRVAGRIADE